MIKIPIAGILLFLTLIGSTAIRAQIASSNAYLIGNFVEIGLDAGGFEGADTLTGVVPGIHFRSNSGNLFGFVADPNYSSWLQFNGDYFTPGSPENGWGLKVEESVNLSNNAANGGLNDFTGAYQNYVDNANCLSVDWEGQSASSGFDLSIKLQYKLLKNETFYTTTVRLINNGSSTIDSLFYYRNLDPDNNVELSGDYATQNTIVNEYTPSCPRTLVSASQTLPWYSFIGLGAIDTNVRVSYGGFANRNAKEIWFANTGTTSLTGIEGTTEIADDAISLAYFTESLNAGDSVEFDFLIILDSSAVDAAFASLYDVGLDSTDLCAQGNIVDTVHIYCPGNTVDLSILGSDVSAFDWTWSPATGLNTTSGTTVTANPATSTLYTALGSTPGTCPNSIAKQVYIEVSSTGPVASWTDPGYQCDSFDLSGLTIFDLNVTPSAEMTYHTSMPDSSTDFSDTTVLGMIYPGDSVWVMIVDTANPICYNVQLIDISFSQLDLQIVSVFPACNGFSDGAIEVVALEAGPGVVYDIGFVTQSTGLFSPLSIGTYSIVSFDNSGCRDTILATIVPAPLIELDSVILISPLCPGAIDGQIEIMASGGTGNLVFSNNGGSTFQSSGFFSGLPAGMQTIIIMDSIGCQFSVDTLIFDPDSISLSASVTDVLLGGDGEIDLTIIGGMPSYVIDWDNDGVGDFNDNEDLTGLIPGTYFVTVIDAYGCSDTLSVVVSVDLKIDERLQSNLLSYPNPMEAVLTVESSSAFSGRFVFADALGRVVLSFSSVTNQKRVIFDVKKLESGMYFIMLYDDNKVVWSRRLVK